MKKMLISTIASFMFLFIIWTLIAYTRYGDDMINYRLDLESTIRYFSSNTSFSGKNLFQLFNDFIDNGKKMLSFSIFNKVTGVVNGNTASYPTGFALLLTVANVLIDPIFTLVYSTYAFVYALAIIFEIILYFVAFITAIFDFVFSPVFVPSSTNPWLQSLQVCKLFFF